VSTESTKVPLLDLLDALAETRPERLTDVQNNPNVYMAPLLGTFYVPPQYQRTVASLGPVAGDFARGARTIPFDSVPIDPR
jgi:hypothetical protein